MKIIFSIITCVASLSLVACAAEKKTQMPAKTDMPAKASSEIQHEGHGVALGENPDMRQAIPLNVYQRHHVLSEMRQLLESTQGVLLGLAQDDMSAVADAAALAAPNAPKTIDDRVSMREVLPEDFLVLGKATHKAFGAIAQSAQNGADKEEILQSLAETMGYCTSCHAAFQISDVK